MTRGVSALRIVVHPRHGIVVVNLLDAAAAAGWLHCLMLLLFFLLLRGLVIYGMR